MGGIRGGDYIPAFVLELTGPKGLYKSFVGVQGAVFQKSPLAAGGRVHS